MLLEQGSLQEASREAELAIDDYWKSGDPKVTQALTLLSMLRHATDGRGDVFESLEDLPTSLSQNLLSEAKLLNEQHGSAASSKMLRDVTKFVDRWLNLAESKPSEDQGEDEKVTELIAEIQLMNTHCEATGIERSRLIAKCCGKPSDLAGRILESTH